MEIREATPADNDALIDLCHNAPMKGVVEAYIDRAPDFFQFARLQGLENRIWLAEKKGRVLGCIAQAKRRALYRGKHVNLIYGGDLKVHPDGRGKRLGEVLTRQVIEFGYENGFDMAEGVIIHGNTRAIDILDRIFERLRWVKAGDVLLYQVLPYKTYRQVNGYHVRAAGPEDADAIIEVLRRTYRDYACAPVFDRQWFDHETGLSETFAIGNFKVAEQNGKIVAVAAFWDQETMRRTVVLRFNSAAKLLVPMLRTARPLFGFPKPPKPGDSLRYEYLRFPGALDGHIEGLKAIMHEHSNSLRLKGEHQFIWASYHQADPLQKSLEKMWKMSMKVNLYHFAFNDGIELPSSEEAKQTPAFADFSLV